MVTTEQIQTAIAKGKYVCFKGHNEGLKVKTFQVTKRFITIEAGNVRRFKIGALDHFLRNVIIYE
jgi:hypothetical protein